MIRAILLVLLTVTSPVLSHPHHAAREYNKSSPIVDLGYATYQGVRLQEAGVDQYLGMRYAAPPLDDLRFRRPHDPLSESGVQDASSVSLS